MAATNKTASLALNQYVSTDSQMMADYNSDMKKIDDWAQTVSATAASNFAAGKVYADNTVKPVKDVIGIVLSNGDGTFSVARAGDLPIEDDGKYYTSDTTEGALQEVGANLTNGSHWSRRNLSPRLGNIVSDDSAVNIQDAAAAPAELSALVVKGKTTETGSGTKSPDNPYTLSGVNPTKVTVCGKNLLKPADGTVTANGVTCTVSADGIITLNGTASCDTGLRVYPSLKAEDWTSQPAQFVLASGKKYTYARTDISSAQNGVTLSVGDTKNNNIFGDLNAARTSATITATGQDVAKAVIFVASGTVLSNYQFKLQLEQADAATYWEQCSSTDYAIALTASLYSLPNGISDTYDLISGLETHNIKVLMLNGTENWTTENGNRFVLTIPDLKIGSAIESSHFASVSSDDTWNGIEGISVNKMSNHLEISYKSVGDVNAFKTWLSAHNVTALYLLDTPVTYQHTPTNIPQPSPVVNIWADAGSINADYSVDLQSVVNKLTAAIVKLGGTV